MRNGAHESEELICAIPQLYIFGKIEFLDDDPVIMLAVLDEISGFSVFLGGGEN